MLLLKQSGHAKFCFGYLAWM